MTGWKGVLKSIKDFSKDISSAPSGHQVRLLTAASDRGKQYFITGTRSDLEEAISAHKAVLDNPPRDPEIRTAVYVSLVAHLKAKYVREGAEDDTLDELIWASQALVELTQEHDTKLLDRLQSLVLCLRLRFDNKKKNYDDVKETIRVLQRCLGAPQLANPTRIKLLDTLAAVLVKQAKHAEESGRQEESIAVIRARAGNTLLGNPDRTTSAHRDLDVTINVNEWLVLPENSNFVGGVMNQARLSNTLGLLYGSRWSHTRAASDICRGIAHLRNALSNARDADKAIVWHNLGLLLLISGRVLNADQDLDEAIQCFQESIKLEHPANLQNLHHRIEQAKNIKASFRPDHALEFFWNILPNSPQDGSEFQQSVDGSSTQPNALPSFSNWADEFEEVAKQRLESETIPRNGSLQFEEQLIDPSQTSDVTMVAKATRHKDATIEMSTVGDFLKQWRSRQIELLIAYRYSPT
ncbi:hypothetical protein G7054_g10740 [Neopestalotiopsis clavispora]|nr:hypothetical protein G7054_g10740 [Neopestalotiopsis clavispora]